MGGVGTNDSKEVCSLYMFLFHFFIYFVPVLKKFFDDLTFTLYLGLLYCPLSLL
jgi:hypothetical protein